MAANQELKPAAIQVDASKHMTVYSIVMSQVTIVLMLVLAA